MYRACSQKYIFKISVWTLNCCSNKILLKNKKISLFRHTKYNKYKKYKNTPLTFKEFAQPVLGASAYKDFIISAGYSDYENEDVFETLFYYGIEDNACCWTAFHVPWKQLVMKLFEHIGEHCFKFSNKVVSIEGSETTSYTVHTEKEWNRKYTWYSFWRKSK